MAKIFLCHASEDKPQVRDVYRRLKAEGFDPWLDVEDLLPGQLWTREIHRVLMSSDFILIFFSQNSVAKRGYIQREVKLALDAWEEIPEGMIYTIPVRLDDCEIPEMFRKFQWLNLFEADGITRLVRTLRAGLSQRQLPRQGFDTQVSTDMAVKIISDPLEVTEQFFSQAGVNKIESLPDNVLLLRSEHGYLMGVVRLWEGEESDASTYIETAIENDDQKPTNQLKHYLVYKGQGPSSESIQSLRKKFRCEIIPLSLTMLERALSTHECGRILKELEEPYITRIDPYAESKPIYDPIWFYGRDSFLHRLPAVLAQGQHVGIFGLRKVGKTSLTNQLRQRFITTPTVFIDCQAFSAQATIFFEEILTQIRTELHAHGMKGLPPLPIIASGEDFRRHFLDLFMRWKERGEYSPFIIIFDEIDKFFPRRPVQMHQESLTKPGRFINALKRQLSPKRDTESNEKTLTEYVHVFRMLRGLAQSYRCLVTLVIAYRPEVNRHDLLTPTVGENPMFQSFQEEYLGSLDAEDSQIMIREIGLWKQILWEKEAAQRVFYYCGGHPLVTRLFASHACRRGTLKTIDYARVEETSKEIQSLLPRNEIGNYYKEGVWDRLREDEQQVLRLIFQGGEHGISETEIPSSLSERNLLPPGPPVLYWRV